MYKCIRNINSNYLILIFVKMVKNTIGGKKGKMLSNKQNNTNNSVFPIVKDENERYVCVTKIFGGGVFEVIDHQNIKYKAYLRGKMKGPNKRHNLVSLFSILLVGIRFDFSDKFSVDILFVYDNSHIQQLILLPLFPRNLIILSQNNDYHTHDHDQHILFNFEQNSLHHENNTLNITHTQYDNDMLDFNDI